MQITKGKRIVAEALGEIPQTGMPVLTKEHPFLRKTIGYGQACGKYQVAGYYLALNRKAER